MEFIGSNSNSKRCLVGAGWRGMDLGQQNNVIPRHLAPYTTKIGARWAGDKAIW